MRYISPLRYPGGKRRVTGFIQDLVERNGLLGGTYMEPFAGGASVAWGLLFGEYVWRIILNDLSRPIYAFWHSVVHQTDELCSRIESVEVTVAEWERQRAIQFDKSAELLDLGFSTFFLNRTNRSGIIAHGGLIGGKDQLGKWKIDARFNKPGLIERIRRMGAYRDRVQVFNLDASEFLQSVATPYQQRALLYLDPPYYVKGSQNLYEDYYNHDDHAALSDQIRELNHPWVVSYDNAPEIVQMYHGLRHVTYELSYSARKRYNGAEAMFFSEGLDVPAVDPGNISAEAVLAVAAK